MRGERFSRAGMLTFLRLLQINLHHCKTATAALPAFVVSKSIDIVLIQEPWTIKGKVCGLTIGEWTLVRGLDPNPRACLFVKRNLNVLMLRDHCCRDLTTVKIQWMHNSGTRDLLLPAYLPHDQEGPPPTSKVKTLMTYAGIHKLQLLLGSDANAHHTIWGSIGTNKGGESLISHSVANGLVTLNRENKPTFVTVSRAGVIDVTVFTLRFAKWVKQWHVSDEPSLSDHRYIRFDIELPQVSKMSYRNPRNYNWNAYRERLIEELERCPKRIKTATDIELLAESLQSAIITSYEASCPVKIRSTNRDTPWWTRLNI
ncbi:hypothetical protein Trydic_g8064 [Trypoxylus dichotomus]